jgi:hypothetical protein
MNYPDLPLIPWTTFVSRVRIRWTEGACPESFFNPDGKQHKMAKKPAAKPAAKKGSGGKGKKDKC